MLARKVGPFATIAAAFAVSACASSAGPMQVAPLRGVAAPFAANLIVNGSFEQLTAPTGGFSQFSTGQTFSQWKVAGASGNVDLIGAGFGKTASRFQRSAAYNFSTSPVRAVGDRRRAKRRNDGRKPPHAHV